MNKTEHRPLISISVPVYNVERHLRQCLDSLLTQTLADIEIILVNDGSTDHSRQICEEYASKDERILLIHKENGGSASARQAALEASSGQYFCACDSDDWVEPDMYERLYRKAVETDADMVICGYLSEYSDGRQVNCPVSYQPESRHDLLDDALNGMFPPQVWSKLLKRDIFDRYALSWEPGINLGEDFLLTLKILQHDVKVVTIPDMLYHYRRELGGNSYTNRITLSSFNQLMRINFWVMESLDTQRYANGIFRLWLSLGFTALRVRDGMTARYYRTEVISHLPLRSFLVYRYPKLKGLLVLSGKLLGYRFAKAVCQLLYKYVYK